MLEEAGAIERNYSRWNVLGTYVWPNQFIGQTYDEEYEHLRQWIATRLAWMDGAIHGL